LAASGPGRPDLLAWERPWRRRLWTPLAKTPRSVTFPAMAALAWNGQIGTFLLVGELATVPLRFFRPAIRGLLALRAFQTALPALVIATTHVGRKAAWAEFLEEVRRERAETPLLAEIVTWTDVRQGLGPRTALMPHEQVSWQSPVRRLAVRQCASRRVNAVL